MNFPLRFSHVLRRGLQLLGIGTSSLFAPISCPSAAIVELQLFHASRTVLFRGVWRREVATSGDPILPATLISAFPDRSGLHSRGPPDDATENRHTVPTRMLGRGVSHTRVRLHTETPSTVPLFTPETCCWRISQ